MQETAEIVEQAPRHAVDETLAAEMAKAGVIYGHKRTKTHPKMREYIAAHRNEIELLKPEAITESINRAAVYIAGIIREKKIILVVTTKPAGRQAMEEFIRTLEMPYVTERWLGGTLTNFKVIQGRIKHYLKLGEEKQTGGWGKYTKKERIKMEEELQKMKRKFEGLVRLERLPDALLVVGAKEHETAMREARRMRIPAIAVVDSDDDPSGIEYPIIANDHAKVSIEWVMSKIMEKARAEETTQETKTP